MLRIFSELSNSNHRSTIAVIKYILYDVVEISKINTKDAIFLKTKTFLLNFLR